MEPQKPFACTILDCGMAFTNEDHLHVHTKKHDMSLQLGSEQKANFVADQTPTPTRFIRNCEEVGLFQELQNVNPFDEGFKRAMETKAGILSLEGAMPTTTDDVLHTPQMVLPTLGDSFTTTNNRSNITISRSSSDESGAIKEYETTTISKRNEVTTISRIVGKQDVLDKITTTDDVSIVRHEELDSNKDIINETVSYTNNIIKIHSNVEIRKENQEISKQNTPIALISYADSVIKDNIITKDVMLTDSNKLQVPLDKIPIMSQKSIDFVVDSLTSDPVCHNEIIDVEREKESPLVKLLKRNHENAANKKAEELKTVASPKRSVIKLNDVLKANSEDKYRKRKVANELKNKDDYEVIIKLPNQTIIRMKAVEEVVEEVRPLIQDETKEKLKKKLINKAEIKTESFEHIIPMIHNVEPHSMVQNWPINRALPITSGTLYPVTIVNPNLTPILLTNSVQKIPIPVENTAKTKPEQYYKKTVKRKDIQHHNLEQLNVFEIIDKPENSTEVNKRVDLLNSTNTDEVVPSGKGSSGSNNDKISKKYQTRSYEDKSTFSKHFLESRSAASRRYRERLKRTMAAQKQENQQLKEHNQRLQQENVALKLLLLEHSNKCADADDLRNLAMQTAKQNSRSSV